MNLIQNYLLTDKTSSIQGVNKNVKQQPPLNEKRSSGNVNFTSMPAVQPDYNVRVPIAYTQLDDVKINDNLSAKCYRLANGQKVVILPKEGPTVVKTYVNTGSFNEKDNVRGISHYIEHNLFNGSEALGDKVFFEEVNKMGANTNASTSFSVTDYFISSNLLEDTDLEKEIELHAGMLTSPKFLIDKLEKEKKIVNSEINMYMAEDYSLGVTQTIKNLFNIKSSSLDLVAGTTDNITKLTRDDVVNYFNNNYYPANMTTVITGEVNPDETIKLISKYFNAPNKVSSERHFEKMTPIDKTIRQDIISPKSEGGASVFIGFAGPENNNYKDKLLLQALNTFAAGLTNSKTAPVERKYGTNINFSTERLSSRPQDNNMISVESYVADDKVEVFLKDLYSSIDRLSKVPPTEDELLAIKNKMKKSRQNSLEISSALNHVIGSAFLNGNQDELQNHDKIVDSITAEDIMNTAKKYLDLNKAALTVVHPRNATDESIKSNFTKSLGCASSVSFTGVNKKTPINVDAISNYRLHNNFDVVLNDANTDIVEYIFKLNEKEWTPKKAAVADVLSNMIDNSGTQTKTVKDLSKIMDTLGISSYLNADDFGFYLKADFPVENTKKSLALFNERILHPNFNQELFEESVERLKDAYSTSEVSAYDKFDAAMYKGLPYQFTAKDKLESLKNITLNDVLDFYNEIFKKSQGSVVVSAPFSKHPELKQEIFNSLGEYSAVQPKDISLAKIYSPQEKTEVFTDVNMKNQAEIIQGFKFKQNGNIKDKVAINLLHTILGGSTSSRLFTDLRESRHLAYGVNSGIDYNEDFGIMELYIKTTTENLETGEKSFDNIKKAIDGFNENIEKLKTQKVSEEELTAAKKIFKGSLLSSLETTNGKTTMIETGNSTLYGVDTVNKILETIDTITVDDIYNAANYIFKNKPVYSLTATKASLDANKEFLNSLAAQ